MAITSLVGYSQQEAQVNAQSDLLKPNEHAGRLRRTWFDLDIGVDYTTAIGTNDTFGLCRLPAGARVYGGFARFTSFGTNTAVDFGIKALDGTGEIDSAAASDDVDFFTQTEKVGDTAGSLTFGVNTTEKFGYELEKDAYLTMTIIASGGTATFSTGTDIVGYIDYVLD